MNSRDRTTPAGLKQLVRRAVVAAFSIGLGFGGLHAQTPLVVDPSLAPELLDRGRAAINDVLELPGGGFLIAGVFTTVDGQAHGRVARIDAAGRLDPGFKSLEIDGGVDRIVPAPGGAFYLVGRFRTVDGVATPVAARVSASGEVDGTFVSTLLSMVTPRAAGPAADGGLLIAAARIDLPGGATASVVKLDAAGALAAGFTRVDVQSGALFSAAFLTDGRFVTTSSFSPGVPFDDIVRRYLPDGLRDATFSYAATGVDYTLARVAALSEGRFLLYGGTSTSASGLAVRIRADGTRDPGFTIWGTNSIRGFLDAVGLSDGSLVARPGPGAITPPPMLVRYDSTGALDPTFSVGTGTTDTGGRLAALSGGDFVLLGAHPGFDGADLPNLTRIAPTGATRPEPRVDVGAPARVETVVVLPDGRLWVGGSITGVGASRRQGLVALSANGAMVADGVPAIAAGAVNHLAPVPGGWVAAGTFSGMTGAQTAEIARLRLDGTADPAFFAGVTLSQTGIRTSTALADGSIVVGGNFLVSSGGFGYSRILRVRPDSTIDAAWPLGRGSSGQVSESISGLAVDGSGRLVLHGTFNSIGTTERPGLARFFADGTLDASFVPTERIVPTSGARLAIQPDNRIVLIGAPTGGSTRFHRFGVDGVREPGFAEALTDIAVASAFLLEGDGSILLGYLDTAAVRRAVVRRLLPDGSLDPAFAVDLGTAGPIRVLVRDGEGNLILGGHFTEVNGVPRNGLARLAPPRLFAAIQGEPLRYVAAGAAATLTTTVSGATGPVAYQWLREGAPIDGATEATFSLSEFSAAKAGAHAVRVTDTVTSFTSAPVTIALPESPVVLRQPENRQSGAGGSVVLRVEADGLPAPTFQWLKDGVVLAGETGARLILRGLTAADVGAYSVRVSNLAGTVESAPALVSLVTIGVDPLFAPVISRVAGTRPTGFVAGAADGSLFVQPSPEIFMGRLAGPGKVRLRGDLQLDLRFDGSGVGTVLLVLPDGRFYADAPAPGGSILRRHAADGAVDPAFSFTPASSGVSGVAVAPEGRLVLLLSSGFPAVTTLVRVHADGSPDPAFAPTGLGQIQAFAVAPDGSVWVYRTGPGGSFDSSLVRLRADGSPDPAVAAIPTLAGGVNALLALGNGDVLVLGRTFFLGGRSFRGFVRVRTDGSFDPSMEGFATTTPVQQAARQLADGRIVVAGTASSSAGGFFHLILPPGGGAPVLKTHAVNTGLGLNGVEVAVLPDGGAIFSGEIFGLFETPGSSPRPLGGVLRLRPDGSADLDNEVTLGTLGRVAFLHPLPRGRWLLGGFFDAVNGARRTDLAVVGADGRVDPGFRVTGLASALPASAVVLEDESLILSGTFIVDTQGSQTTRKVVHLAPDGTLTGRLDSHFTPFLSTSPGLGLLPDGRFIVAAKSALDSRPGVSRITRFNPDSSIDTGFDVQLSSASTEVFALADGRILVSTAPPVSVTDSTGATGSGLVRLLADGRIDPAFAPPSLTAQVRMAAAPSGGLYVWGSFTSVAGQARNGVARLLADGSLDPLFVPPAPPLPRGNVAGADAEGRLIVLGSDLFTGGGPTPQGAVARLNADGTRDPSLNLAVYGTADSFLSVAAVRPNGDVVVAGRFSRIGESARTSIGRITTNGFQAHPTRGVFEAPPGGEVFVGIELSGAGAPEVRWFQNGVERPGADRPVLVLRDLDEADAGIYHAEVASGGSLVRTDDVRVRVRPGVFVKPVSSLAFSESGGVGGIYVNASGSTSWNVSAPAPWIQTGPILGAGAGTLGFTVAPNIAGPPRTAVIQIAGSSFTVEQGGVSSRLANISTRGRNGLGDETMIVGFVTAGVDPLSVLGRGVGPTLGRLGVGGVLPDPTLRLVQGAVEIRLNNDWDGGAERATIFAESRRVGAFDLDEGGGDAALIAGLAPGAYTMLLGDTASRGGVALVELYDLTLPAAAGWRDRVLNLSTRGRVGRGDEVLIAGFVVTGPASKQVLIRGIGPTLGGFGVKGVLADPLVRLVRDGETMLVNDDWGASESGGVLARAMQEAGAFPLALDSRDAAALVTLAPGAYTVVLSGADDGTGVALLEVYDLE